MSKTNISERTLHHSDFIDKCPPYFIVYFLIF
jgi:hypothetical protein